MRWMILALSAASVLGCSEEPAEPAAAEPAAAEPAAAEPAGAERMIGTWNILLSEAERRRQAVMKLAVQDPPASPEAIRAMALSPREQTQLQLTQAAMRSGDEALIHQLRATAEGLDKAVLTITEDQLVMQFGDVRDVSTYAVSGEGEGEVTIEARREGEPEELLRISFPAPDQLQLSDPSQPGDAMRFRRAP